MQVRALGSINGYIDEKKRDWLHGANRVNPVLIAGRTAFLALIRLNVWGMAANLNLLWARSSAGMNDEKQKWINAWWNLGGIFSNLQDAVVAGRSKKAIAIRLAPIPIQMAYKEATGKGIGRNKIGEATLAATLTAAAGVISTLTGLLVAVFKLLGKDAATEDGATEDVSVALPVNTKTSFASGGGYPPPEDPTKQGINLKTLAYVGIAAGTLYALSEGWKGGKRTTTKKN